MKHLILILFIGFFSCNSATTQKSTELKDSTDNALFMAFKKLAQQQHFKDYKMGKRAQKTGMFFLQTPYVSHTLDKDTCEQLVVNLHQLDCSTFVENVVALCLAINADNLNVSNFTKQLQKIRYRNGKLTDYSSRLHYFSDWIFDNQQKGIIKDLSKDIGGVIYKNKVDFMGKHPQSYLSLKHNKAMVNKIKKSEQQINSRKQYYIPQANIKSCASKIKSGDIIGITTNIKGLDISHVGFAVRINGEIFLMNASTKVHKVVIYETPLWEMIQKNRLQTGIVVARINE